MKRILLFSLVCLVALSCKKEADVTPTDTCKLAQFGDGGTTNDLTYDAAGNLTQWAVTSDLQGGSKFVITYAFTHDATGRISTRLMTIAIDGKVQVKPAPTQYTYTNGLLTGANTVFNVADSAHSIRTVNTTYTYDSNQRVSKAVSTETGFSQTSTYEYDSRATAPGISTRIQTGLKAT